jgi:hypothetical protein
MLRRKKDRRDREERETPSSTATIQVTMDSGTTSRAGWVTLAAVLIIVVGYLVFEHGVGVVEALLVGLLEFWAENPGVFIFIVVALFIFGGIQTFQRHPVVAILCIIFLFPVWVVWATVEVFLPRPKKG